MVSWEMTSFSALSLLLLEHPGRPGMILESLRSGEIDPRRAVALEPALLVEAVARMTSLKQQAPAQLELVQRLIQHGFDPWHKDAQGLDTFDSALLLKHPGMISWLAQRSDAPTHLGQRQLITDDIAHSPLFGANVDATQAMLEIGFDPLVVDHQGRSLLHDAHDPRVVRLLIQAGADPTTKDHQGLSAQEAWDVAPLSIEKRQALDAVLNETHRTDPEYLIRNFGRSITKVGITYTKDRLQKAGVNPKTAQHEGFDLPEILIATILNDGMQCNSYFGDPSEQKRLRKLVLSALKMRGQPDPTEANGAQRLGGLVLAFTLISEAISNSATKEVDINNNLGYDTRKDATVDELKAWVSKGNNTPAAQMIHAFDGIETLRKARLIENPSWVHGWLMMAGKSSIPTAAGWMEPCEDGSPLFYAMGRRAMRSLWDHEWKENKKQQENGPTSNGRSIVPSIFLLGSRSNPRWCRSGAVHG
jgi:hypothetical protein